MLTARLKPSQFSRDIEKEHAGRVSLLTVNNYLLYGISDRVNAIVKIPWVKWAQSAEEPDNHHRTETITGFRDLSFGLRWVIRNETVGPGQRLFLGINMSIPSAESYSINPFTEDADSVKHSHFALGTGQTISDLNGEWWFRSEFPWVLGITGLYRFSWQPSVIDYRLGQQAVIVLHGIRQEPVFRNSFVYIRLTTKVERPDLWDGEKAPNSGGVYMDWMAGLNFEFTESLSGVLSFEYPLWRAVRGTQLDPLSMAISIRKIMN